MGELQKVGGRLVFYVCNCFQVPDGVSVELPLSSCRRGSSKFACMSASPDMLICAPLSCCPPKRGVPKLLGWCCLVACAAASVQERKQPVTIGDIRAVKTKHSDASAKSGNVSQRERRTVARPSEKMKIRILL